MNAVSSLFVAAPQPLGSPRARLLSLIAIWLAASAIAIFFALVLQDSTTISGVYLPRGNDSFYHARRILDAAIGSRGFYQFDDHLQVPEGTWIPWPWGYDYLMAKATQVALWLQPGLDPMKFISYVPVAFVLVNAALFLAATGALGLSFGMRAVAMLAFALSPLTQLLHAIGMIDHHYVEHTFVLLTIWLGLRWFERPEDQARAAALGATLGIAPAFHNGLFILQLCPLASVFVLWLRDKTPPLRALSAFGIGLVALTQLIVIPSEPFRHGMFEFGLLSWFHVYVAVCTCATMLYMGRWQRSRRHLAVLCGLAALLALPIAGQALSGASFLSGRFSVLGEIAEAQSPYRLFTDTFGPAATLSYYSCLLLAAPLLLPYYGYRVLRESDPKRLYFAVFTVFGLSLLGAQLRLHYYGFFVLVCAGLVLIDRLRERWRWNAGMVFVGTLAAVALAYQPSLRHRLFTVYAPGAEVGYGTMFPLFLELGRLCAEDPGVVLASHDDGSAILFHTQCSVIANNFILRPADATHIEEVHRLMTLSPEQMHAQRPDIKYLFLRVRDFSSANTNWREPRPDNPMGKALFLDDSPPKGFELIRTIRLHVNPADEGYTYARLYKVTDAAP